MSLAYLREQARKLELEFKRETWQDLDSFREFAEERGYEKLADGSIVEALLKGFFDGEWKIVDEFEAWREGEGSTE